MDRRTEPSVIRDPMALQVALAAARRDGERVGFVPTMGALHEGHMQLVRAAREHVGARGTVAVSIFVNPTQFGANEDLARYPRTLDADMARCTDAGVDIVFAPDANAMYLPGEQTRVSVGALAGPLCGRFRPGHFEGVATIVAKLFALVGPAVTVFGRKDFQQLAVIRRMAQDLFFPVEVVGARTVRDPDGLAMSSRNRYLREPERQRALAIPRALGHAVNQWDAGERNVDRLRAEVAEAVDAVADSVDYVEVLDPDALTRPSPDATRVLLALALHIGTTRLIDNVVLGDDAPPV